MSLYIEIAWQKIEEFWPFPPKQSQPILMQVFSSGPLEKRKVLTWSPTVPGMRYFLWESWRILFTSTSAA